MKFGEIDGGYRLLRVPCRAKLKVYGKLITPKGPKGEKCKADVIGNAVRIVRIATGEVEDATRDDGKDKATQAMGRNKIPRAMAAGIPKTLMSWLEIVEMMDADFKPNKRGPYKKTSELCKGEGGAFRPAF